MAYRIIFKSKIDGSVEEYDAEEYSSREEAEEALDDVIGSFMTGAEVLELAGEDFNDPDDYEFKIKKI